MLRADGGGGGGGGGGGTQRLKPGCGGETLSNGGSISQVNNHLGVAYLSPWERFTLLISRSSSVGWE